MVEWGHNVKIMVAKMLHGKKQKQLSLVLQRDKRLNTSYRPLASMATPRDFGARSQVYSSLFSS